jgi:KDO2-lipid IV(A) lauroyltransferase
VSLSQLVKKGYYVSVTPLLALFWSVVPHVPERAHRLLARIVGEVVLFGRKQAALENMSLVLGCPRLAVDRRRLWRDHATQLGYASVELIQWERMTDEELRASIRIEGEELLQAALRERKGVMLLTTHLGNLIGIAPALGLRGYGMHVASGPMEVDYLSRKVADFVRRCGVMLVFIGDDLPRRAKLAFERNEIFTTFIDYSVIARHAAWLSVGRAEMRVNTGPVIVALRAGAPIMLAHLKRLGRNTHVLSIRPVIGTTQTGVSDKPVLAIARSAIAIFERELLARPEQWWRWDYAPLRSPQSPS